MRLSPKTLPGLALAACAALASHPASAQTTDGYHSIQVFPVVVDTASFTQRFDVRNPSQDGKSLTFNAKYFPAVGTSQAAPLDCGNYTVNAGMTRTFVSLRELCPGLAAGSQFGFLYLHETETRAAPFAAYSRVSNPQGNGFSVEAFAAYTFNRVPSSVIGARRKAAGVGTPAFQTNCFVASLNEVNAGAGPYVDTQVVVYDSNGNPLGAPTMVSVQPGKITRILDVFAFVGAPAGDHDNAVVRFFHDLSDPSGIFNFCTVQDNTSFGADFRIAKPDPDLNASDPLYTRDARTTVSVVTSTSTGYFRILGGGNRHNTHVMYFRNPDYVQCELVNPNTGVRALPGYGLEMRMLADDGTTVLAGGSDQTGFGKIYLGDKKQNFGYNRRYTIDVENSGANDIVGQTPYDLRCQSGSGHSMGDLVVDNVVEDLF